MSINDFYPRKIGGLFFLVCTRDSSFMKVNEIVFDMVSANREGNDRRDVAAKYSLSSDAYEKVLTDISKALHDA